MINQKYLYSQDGNKKVYLRCILDKYEVTDKITKKVIKTETSPGVGMNGIGTANNYHGQVLNETLKSNTTYQVNINYKWLKITSIEGQADKEEVLSEEKMESNFTTGMPEDFITQDMIAAQSPGYRQRYWTKDYAKAIIKLNEAISQDQIAKLFPEEVQYKRQLYFAVITENKTDGSVVYHRTAVTNFPNNYRWKSTFSTDKTLLIPGLDSMKFDNGSFCTMSIFRATDELGDYDKLTKLETMSGDENLAKESATQKIIYTTHFGISQYNSVYDKLRDVKVTAAVSNSSIAASKRKLLMADEQIQEIVDADIETLQLIPKNVYYGIKGSKEGIDSFDFNKIKNSASFGFNKNPNYYGWTKKYYFDKLVLCLINFRASPAALVNSKANKVIDKFTDNLRRQDDGFSPTANKNEYAIFSPVGVGNKYELTSDEITNSRLNSEKVNYSMGDGPYLYSEEYTEKEWNPDIILEDGIASTSALQYLFTKISILKVLGQTTPAIQDGEGLNNSKYYGSDKYFTVTDLKINSPKKYLMEKYYDDVSTLIFSDPNSFKMSIININPETLLFKNIVK